MHVCVKIMSKGSKEALTVLIMVIFYFFYFFQLVQYRIFHTTLQHSMQHALSTPLTYPGSWKTCFFCIPVFGMKSFLIFPVIYLTVDLKLICIIGLSDLINPLISANSWMTQLLTLGVSFPVSWAVDS